MYRFLLCEEKDNKLFLVDKKNNVELVFGKEDVVGLGNQVYKILSSNLNYTDKAVLSFQTVNKNKVLFTRPSDDFEDIGDGHTDAYQIYTYENNDKNYIAFLIDNGYLEFTENAIS